MSTVGADGLPPLQIVTEVLADLFSAPFSVHRLRTAGPGLVPEFYATGKLDRAKMAGYFDLLATGRGAPIYSVIRPREAERNVALTRRDLRLEHSPHYAKAIRMLGSVDLTDHDQLRVLLCDGSLLLAWCGALRDRPFTPSEKQLLQSLAPILREPMTLGRRLRDSGVNAAGLAATLEALVAPAFITDASGAIAHANRLGAQLIDRDRLDVRAEVSRQSASGRAREIRVNGQPSHQLIMLEDESLGLRRRLELASRTWGLSQRQAAVLAHVVHGLATRSVAAKLDCAEVTVEMHLTAIYLRSGARTRAALISRFWML